LPSARKKTLGKGAFAVTFFTECGLPSAALGKPFAECKRAFAECIRHSANKASAVVLVICVVFQTLNSLAANVYVYVPVGGYKSTLQPVFTYLLLLFEDVFK